MVRWLTVSETAQRLNLSPDRVRQLANEARLPCERTERGVRLFSVETVARVAAERRALARREASSRSG